MKGKQRSEAINKVSITTLIINVILAIIKFVAGVVAHSQAMISDSIHTLSDVFSTVIVLIGVNIAKKNRDEKHPYGHEKLESIASIILALILILTAFAIGVGGVKSIRQIILGNPAPPPTYIALIAAVLSIAVKEWMFHYTKKVSVETNSTALLADAWHHRSDSISSIGSLIGIGGAMLGAVILDPFASILIAALILKVGIEIGVMGINEVTDHAADTRTQQIIQDTILGVEGVLLIDELKTRLHGNMLWVDVDIAVDGEISVEKAHDIADNVSKAVYFCDMSVKECMVHVNPYREKGEKDSEHKDNSN